MAITLIRKNSDTPNVRNYDDARLFRYIVQDRSGIIKDYGDELALSQSGASTLHISTGEIVHQGWQVEVSGSGVDLPLDNRDAVEYYSVYLEINLSVASQQTAEIKFLKGNADYPVISPGDDLTTTPSGTSRLLIAKVYLVPSTSTFTITPVLEVLSYFPQYALEADYASSDHSKGTIEQRLTDLGFKSGSCTYSFSQTPSTNSLVKQGQMVRFDFAVSGLTITSGGGFTLRIPDDFKPSLSQKIIILVECQGYLFISRFNSQYVGQGYNLSLPTYFPMEVYVSNSGVITLSMTQINTEIRENAFRTNSDCAFNLVADTLVAIRIYTGWKLN